MIFLEMAQITRPKGLFPDDRSLEKYLARLGELNERDGNDVGSLNDVIVSHRFCVHRRPRLLHLNEQLEKKERPPRALFSCLVPGG